MKNLIFVLLLLSGMTRAHNGKIAYALPQAIVVDGEKNDWGAIDALIRLGTDFKDFRGAVRFGFDEGSQLLYLGLELYDDELSNDDILEIYINAGHFKRAPSNLMLRFQKEEFTFFKHEASKDPVHATIEERDVDAADKAMANHLNRANALYHRANLPT